MSSRARAADAAAAQTAMAALRAAEAERDAARAAHAELQRRQRAGEASALLVKAAKHDLSAAELRCTDARNKAINAR